MKTVQKVSSLYKYFDIYVTFSKVMNKNEKKKFKPTILNLFEE